MNRPFNCNRSGFELLRSLAASMLLSWLCLCFMSIMPAGAQTFSARVVAVIDGDSLRIQLSDKKQNVILFGVDCPEIGQDYGKQARQFTDDKCYRKTVNISLRGKDRLGRLIAVVTLPDGTNLNQELVRRGLAWWSDKYAPKDEVLKRLHNQARSAHIGLWSEAKPIPPWIFRNGQRSVGGTIISK